MSDTITLKAEIRERVGSKAAAALRNDKTQPRLPVVVYGHGQAPLAVSLNMHEFVEGLHHGHRIFEVELPDGKETLLVKDLQYDHLGKKVIHADLVRVNLNELVTVQVPIELRGTAQGTTEGGMLEEALDHLEIECVVSNIPETVPVIIKDLEVGQSIHAKDVTLPEGAALKTDPEAILVVCHPPKAQVEAEAAEEGESPEGPVVITERAAKEESE